MPGHRRHEVKSMIYPSLVIGVGCWPRLRTATVKARAW